MRRNGKEGKGEGRRKERSRAALAPSPGVQVPHLRPCPAGGAGRIPPRRAPARRAPRRCSASHVFWASVSARPAERQGPRAGTASAATWGQVEGEGGRPASCRLPLLRGGGPWEDACFASSGLRAAVPPTPLPPIPAVPTSLACCHLMNCWLTYPHPQ